MGDIKDTTSQGPSEDRLSYKGSVGGLRGLLQGKLEELGSAVGQTLDRMSERGVDKGSSSTKIPIEFIHPSPDQPRQFFDPESLEELAETLENLGQAQAITVRRVPRGYEVISGERRYRAAKLAGLTHLDCVVKECSPAEARLFALVENTQRQDLLPFEEAMFLVKVLEENPQLRLDDLARSLGSHKSTLSEKMQMREIPEDLRHQLFTKKGRYLTHRHWRILSRIGDSEHMREAFARAIDQQLSVAQLEKSLAELGVSKAKRRPDHRQLPLIRFPVAESRYGKIRMRALELRIHDLTTQTRDRIISELETIIEVLRRTESSVEATASN